MAVSTKLNTNASVPVITLARNLCNLMPPRRKTCCAHIPPEIIHDPNPEIYAPQSVFENGIAPTFNSPDINTVNIWPLRPIDSLAITCRNLSTEASANQTRVNLRWSTWGIGMPQQPLGTTFVDLARAGFPGSTQTFSWPVPALPDNTDGLFGVFVSLSHPYDSDPTNNQGEQTLAGFQTSSAGRTQKFVVPVRNPSSTAQTILLTASPSSTAAWVDIQPAALTLGAGAQQDVAVTIQVPAAVPVAPPGTDISATVDILATIGGAYLGGVSFIVLIDQ